jgi:triacylglycerol lipase
MADPPPLVMIHGLWDTPQLFRRLEQELHRRRPDLELYAPHLPHRLGAIPIVELAERLAALIEARFDPATRLDLLGFSMGGVIGRTWLQLLGGHRRLRRFTCLGSPQQGTLAAQLVPRVLLAGIADMKIGSPLLRRLDADLTTLRQVECRSLYCPTDITVFPGWRAVLPLGPCQAVPVWTHRQLIVHPQALGCLADVLLAP